MESNNSYGTSWADQWDYNAEPLPPVEPKKSGGGVVGKKVGDGLGKTKEVASSGLKKVKEGTSVGFRWIKDKYHKTTNKA